MTAAFRWFFRAASSRAIPGPLPFPPPRAAGLSGENWTVVRAQRFAANFGSESPLPGLVPGIHVSSQPGSPRQRRGWPDQVRPRGLSLVAQDRSLATASDSPDSPARAGAVRVGLGGASRANHASPAHAIALLYLPQPPIEIGRLDRPDVDL